MKKIFLFEPFFFLFFGLFHLHRIWALFDRAGYARFWLGVLESKGVFYYGLMGLLAALCVLGMAVFLRCRRGYWWRWAYLFGGGYVLFDLFAIAAGLESWRQLLAAMFDVNAPYWNILWAGFALLGAAAFGLGLFIMRLYLRQEKAAKKN